MQRILLVAVACLLLSLPAFASEVVVNGSFEPGTFLGWTPGVAGTPYLPWNISPGGISPGFGMFPTQPQHGILDAWNGFDGQGPMAFTLYQDLTIPRCTASRPLLKWKDRLQWNFAVTFTATMPRTYKVEIRPVSGPPVAVYSFSTGIAHDIGDSGWQSHTVDLSTYAGMNIRLWFEEFIPEAYTGPGQYELDSVSLDVADVVSVDSCCSTVPNRVADPATGTTLQTVVNGIVDRCTAFARNHGAFVSCVTQGLNDLRGPVINGQEKGSISSCAARSTRGKKYQ